MKYLLAGVFALILAFGVFAYKSNESDKERLKQAEIAHQQKLEQEKLNEAKALQLSAQRQAETEKAKALKAEQERLNGEKRAKEYEQERQEKIAQEKITRQQESKYTEDEWLAICKSSTGAAKAIMSSRQKGASMTEMMDKVVRPADPAIKDVVRALVIDAYSRPRFDTPEFQQKSILDFENSAYLSCIKARP